MNPPKKANFQARRRICTNCTGLADSPETKLILATSTKMAVPLYHRQSIQRIPGYLPMKPPEKPSSPSGSWRTLSMESKSTSTSSGYGTPCAVHGEGYCRHLVPVYTAMPCSSNLSYDTALDTVAVYKKRSYNALKQRSGEMYYYRLRDNLSSPRRLESQRKLNEDQARLYDMIPEHQHQQRWQYHLDCRLSHHCYSHVRRSTCSCHRDYCSHRHNYYDLSKSPYLSSSSSAASTSWREDDGGYSPLRAFRPPSPSHLIPSKWKSESDLRVRTLDEEANEIYNELLDTADMLASLDQKTKTTETLLIGGGMDPPPVPQRHKSCYNLRNSVMATKPKGAITSRPIPKLLDRRRQRRTSQLRSPTNMTPQRASGDVGLSCPLERSTNVLMPDCDEESALEALEAVVNLEYLKPKPGLFANGGRNSGPTPIIRAYSNETEDDWLKQQDRHLNRNVSPINFSVIEIDDDDDNTEKLGPETLPLDVVDAELIDPIHTQSVATSGQGSGSYSEFTDLEDMSCLSDLDV
ncbi:conserved hypothetical protein [Echinococcus multilocularis]|uniref:Uncharacterized protein n=1 Tax=Echinococcus multilocularis TaxID=6211 RepID=A0A068YHQ8_ECHMU|nr:conserved hypothetical protein [Echinococcus multilocularis]